MAFPAAVVGGHAWWTARYPGRVVAFIRPVGQVLTLAVFLAVYGTTWYALPIGFLSDAALLFFGASMLLSAIRGYAGYEVLASSNWLLRRDDQVGCVMFDAIDRLERRS